MSALEETGLRTSHWARNGQRFILAAAVVAVLAAGFQSLWLLNINWDEFNFLSKVHDYGSGRLRSAFQTFHVHLFGWVTKIPGTEIEQVLSGRVAMFALGVATCMLVFRLGDHLVGRTGAWFSVLAALTFSYVLHHFASFRADPMIVFLFLGCATLLVLHMSSWLAVVGAAAALALAILISIKSVFYLPTIAVIFATALASTADGRQIGLRFAVFSAVSIAAYSALYAIHSGSITGPPITAVAGRVVDIGQRMWMEPRLEYFLATLTTDWAFWILFVAGIMLALHQTVQNRGEPRRRALLLLGLALPATSLLFYRNTYPYFYTAVLPAAAILCGLCAARVESALAGRPGMGFAAIAAMAIPLAANAVTFHVMNRHDGTAPQRQVIEAIHDIFPDPVAYIDRCDMVTTFPKAGFFMSTFVLSAYRERGTPVMERIVRDAQPAFVLANIIGLDLSLRWDDDRVSAYRLLEADFDYLKANYVHHWGPLWVAGKSLQLVPGEMLRFELPVAGAYTVESGFAIELDGRSYRDGDVVDLAAGPHTVRSPAGSGPVTLRYGNHLHTPADSPMATPLFRGLR